jgi:hypothetical protein
MRVEGVRQRIAVGKGLGLAEARREAEQIRAAIARGEDPMGARRARKARRKAAAQGIGTLGSIIAAYYEQGPGAGLKSGVPSRALVELAFTHHLARPAVDVHSAELQLAVDGCRSKSSAKRIVTSFRPLMRWAAKRGTHDEERPARSADAGRAKAAGANARRSRRAAHGVGLAREWGRRSLHAFDRCTPRGSLRRDLVRVQGWPVDDPRKAPEKHAAEFETAKAGPRRAAVAAGARALGRA